MSYTPRNPNGQATMANSEPVVLASDQSAVPVVDVDNTASGTISTQNLVPAGVATANSAVEIVLGQGQNTIAIQTVGTYTGALTLQGTVDGTNWVSFAGTPILNANTGLWLATITSALQSVFFAKVSGFAKVRISANAAVTGSVVVSIGASVGDSFQGALGVLTTVTTVTTLTTLTNITNWGNIVDNAAFTDGTTRLMPAAYIYDEVAGTGLTENDAAAARIDVKRAQVGVIEDETTRGRRLTITAANAAKVDGSAVTQPVSIATAPVLVAGSAIIGKVGIDQTTPGTTNGVQVNAALPAGANNIGDVDVVTMPNVTLAAGTNTNEVVGDVAEDAALAGNPVRQGVRASAAEPTSMGADGRVVTPWGDRKGRQVVTSKAGTSALTSVAGSASSVSLLAANTSRLGAIIFNDSTAILYVRLEAAAASTSNFAVKLQPDGYYEVPFGYTGEIRGIWASATGNARVTELT